MVQRPIWILVVPCLPVAGSMYGVPVLVVTWVTFPLESVRLYKRTVMPPLAFDRVKS